jgi:hypothetical protein
VHRRQWRLTLDNGSENQPKAKEKGQRAMPPLSPPRPSDDSSDYKDDQDVPSPSPSPSRRSSAGPVKSVSKDKGKQRAEGETTGRISTSGYVAADASTPATPRPAERSGSANQVSLSDDDDDALFMVYDETEVMRKYRGVRMANRANVHQWTLDCDSCITKQLDSFLVLFLLHTTSTTYLDSCVQCYNYIHFNASPSRKIPYVRNPKAQDDIKNHIRPKNRKIDSNVQKQKLIGIS